MSDRNAHAAKRECGSRLWPLPHQQLHKKRNTT